ncbi:MAG: TetR/AcrR family transcriptional regulator [Zoogloeaceae bacterium]|jgi:AcrR family transcriptional regulator|nr:TetR/AcrR family transcriptional regulator [Zoogloeaceae bacterium]
MCAAENQRQGIPAKARKLKSCERRAALLRAAKTLSVEEGVAMPSLDAIIQRAGGSRRSIYTEFGGKAGLLSALIENVSAEILASLYDDIRQEEDLRATLLHFARRLATALMSAHGAIMSRIVLQDCFSSRERAAVFFARGPGKGANLLAQVLEKAQARGEIEVRDCRAAAGCFIGMVRGNLFLERALQLRPPPDEAEIGRHVEAAVEIFLRGIRKTEKTDA